MALWWKSFPIRQWSSGLHRYGVFTGQVDDSWQMGYKLQIDWAEPGSIYSHVLFLFSFLSFFFYGIASVKFSTWFKIWRDILIQVYGGMHFAFCFGILYGWVSKAICQRIPRFWGNKFIEMKVSSAAFSIAERSKISSNNEVLIYSKWWIYSAPDFKFHLR